MCKEGKFVHIGRIIFTISNLFCLIVGVLLLGTGLGTKIIISGMLNTEVKGLPSDIKAAFGLEYDKSVSVIPLVNDVMWTLIAFGVVIIIISLCAFGGAVFENIPLLIIFIILVLNFILLMIVVTTMFLKKDSSLLQNFKDRSGDHILNNYKHLSENSTMDQIEIFTRTINSVNILFECCGIRGRNDFVDHPAASCCKKEIFLVRNNTKRSSCFNGTASTCDLYQEGCFDKILKVIEDNKAAAIFPLILILTILVGETVFAVLMIRDISQN